MANLDQNQIPQLRDELTMCNLQTHEFSEKLMNTNVTFFVIKLKDCFLLWIGSRPTLSQLSVAMMIPLSSLPTATNIMGDFSDLTSQNFATRLAKRTKKQVYVSCNVLHSESLLLTLIEKRLHEEMVRFPDKF